MNIKKYMAAMLHPKLLENLSELQTLACELYDKLEDNSMPQDFIERRKELLIEKIGIEKAFDGVYRAPYLNPKATKFLRDISENFTWSPNEDEELAYQMNEVVLKHKVPRMYEDFKALYEDTLVPLWMIISGTMATEIHSIQLAKYLPDNRPNTGWHYDDDSECTTVVELSEHPEETGASLKVFPNINLGLAKSGWVTLFNGRTVLHATEPVTSERKILVHWTYRE